MKRIILSLLLALIGLTAGAAKTKAVVWHEPQAIYMSNAIFHITSVELKPEETVMHVHIQFHPKYWIRFDSNCYLLTDSGDKYAILSGAPTAPNESTMPLSDYFWMPESGEVNVALHFQPLPADIDVFHFVEPVDNGWAWWNIRDTKAKYRSPIPEEWQQLNYAADEVLPDAKVQKGTATLKLRLLGYRPEMKFSLKVHFKPLNATREYFDKDFHFADDGTLTAEVPLYLARTVSVAIEEASIYLRPVLAPGETTEMLIDLNRLKDPFVAFKGFLARTNFESTRPEKTTDDASQKNAIKLLADIQKQKTPIERLQFFRKRLDRAIAACNKERKTSAWKALRRMMYEQDYLSWIHAYDAEYADLRIGIYFHNRAPRNFEEYDSISRSFHDEAIGKLRFPNDFEGQEDVLLEEEKHIASMEIMQAAYAPASEEFWSGIPWSDERASAFNCDLHRLEKALMFWDDKTVILNHPDKGLVMTQSQVSASKIKFPAVLAVLEEFKAEQERIRQQLAAQGNVFYQQLDSVPPSDILQTILDRYKDKPVLLDIWATWCGPCRAGHQQLAPLKEEMQKRGVQFIYITSPSSPVKTWQTMIKDIPGDHYYLTREQENHLMKLYASDGIPTYAIYDRDGNRAYFHIGLPSTDDTNEIRRVLEDALNKPTYTGSLVVGKDTITVQNAHYEP